jgi:type I restriction enzyme R subunit
MSNFSFLKAEWLDIYEAAEKAESLANSDARASCFYARRSLELAVSWLYKHDYSLRLPYQDHLSALIHEPTFQQTVGAAIFAKTRLLKDLGNLAVHSHKPVNTIDAQKAVYELFHVHYWLTRHYARGAKPADSLGFKPSLLAKKSADASQTLDQLQKLEGQIRERDEKLSDLLRGKTELDSELEKLRQEISEIKKKNAETPDVHDYSEAETRDYFIDLLLKEAGWGLDKPEDVEFEVSGMPSQSGVGFVDYVLWGDDGKPLGLVEAKKTRVDSRKGQRQAELYANCLEKRYGQRPIIFYSNGYEHWIWDDTNYPPRATQGFYKKAELELLIQRRQSKKPLADISIDNNIVERYYQVRAIRKIADSFEHEKHRKALVVMATGAGKTRTVIALCDLLMRSNWVKRVLFLADRVALVKQAVKAFGKHLPASSPVNLVTEKDAEGRVFVSTYPTMVKMIDETH